jgi:hypothetical protein
MKKYLVFTLLLPLLAACDLFTEGKQGGMATYPLRTGNSWDYHFTSTVKATDSIPLDSVRQWFPDYSYDVHVEVGPLDTLFNAYRLSATSSNHLPADYFSIINPVSYSWEYNGDNGLYLAAYENSSLVLPLKPAAIRLVWNNQVWLPASGALLLPGGAPTSPRDDGPIYREDPPIQVLAYPLNLGMKWMYRYGDQSRFRIQKEMIRQETVSVPAGNFYTKVILWKYDIDGDGVVDEDLRITDWFAEKGLVYRKIEISGVQITTMNGDNLGQIDLVQEAVLTGHDVVVP